MLPVPFGPEEGPTVNVIQMNGAMIFTTPDILIPSEMMIETKSVEVDPADVEEILGLSKGKGKGKGKGKAA